MDLSTGLGLLAVVALVLANGFFVATEFAIVAVRRSRLEQLEAEGHPTAKAARDVVGHLDAYIAACQLGITMASLALGWMGEPALAHLIEPPLEALIGQFAPAASHGIAVGISFAIITALHIVIGELAPKGLALQRPEGTTLWITPPIRLFYVLFRWPITLLNAVGNGVLRLAGLHPATGHEMVHSVEELRLLVTGMQRAGTVEASEALIASRAFEFADLTTGALMTPRTEIEALSSALTLDQVLARVGVTTHSRLPIYEDTLDNVVGVLHVRDLFKVMELTRTSFDVRSLAREPLRVPESMPADDLLEVMRRERRQLAVVLDEWGGTAGIVTLEDLLEALVGAIEEEEADVSQVLDVPTEEAEGLAQEGSIVFEGLTRLREFEETSGLHLGEDAHEDVETLGGLVMARLGRIPTVGEEVTVVDNRRLRVEQMRGRRVSSVRLLPVESATVES